MDYPCAKFGVDNSKGFLARVWKIQTDRRTDRAESYTHSSSIVGVGKQPY